MNAVAVDTCPLCGARKESGTTTFSAELGFGVIVVRHVPALVCQQCGADWIENDVMKRVERYVDHAREKKQEVQVVGYGATGS